MPKLNALDVISGDISEAKRISGVVITVDDEQEVMHHNGGRTNRRVTKVTFTPDAAVTGDDADNFILSLVNRGTDGLGTDVVATLEFDTGTDAVKADGKDIPLSATLANRIILPGEVLQAEKTETGNGLAMPAGDLQITYENVGDAIV